MAERIGIDLGNSKVLFYQETEGMLLLEPMKALLLREDNTIKGIGKEVDEVTNRVTGLYFEKSPWKEGRLGDTYLLEKIMEHYIKKTLGEKLRTKPFLGVSVPSGLLGHERDMVENVLLEAGAREVVLLERPLAEFLGAGFRLEEKEPILVVHIGATTVECSVIAEGEIKKSQSLFIAGEEWTKSLQEAILQEYGCYVYRNAVEELKRQVGLCYLEGESLAVPMAGRDLKSGAQRDVFVEKELVRVVLEKQLQLVEIFLEEFIENMPQEDKEYIRDRGVLLTGGSGMLKGLEKNLESSLHMPVVLPPDSCVLGGKGALTYLRGQLKGGKKWKE